MTFGVKEQTTEAPIEPVIKDLTKHKRITLSCLNGKTWQAEFDGLVTSRDIKRLHRTLTVEYAKIRRRRSTVRIMRQQTLHRKQLAKTQEDKKDNSNDSSTSTSS